MRDYGTIQGYLKTVMEQIRWKRARSVVARELEQHLTDQRDAFVKAGKPEDEAEQLAVEDMGDPVEVGAALDAVHRPRPQWGLLGLTLVLALAGAVLRAVFCEIGGGVNAGHIAVPARALASLGLGTAALLGMYFLDVSRLVRHARAVYIGALAAGLLTLFHFPHVGNCAYYTRYVVLFYPVAYALALYRFREKGWKGFLLAVLSGVPLAAVCCLAPSMTGLLILQFSGLALTLCAAGGDWFGVGRWKGVGAALAVPEVLLTGLISGGYLNAIRQRLAIALHPELDPLNKGYLGWRLHLLLKDIPLLRSPHEGKSLKTGMRVYSDSGEFLLNDFSNDFLPSSMAVAWGWLPLMLLLGLLAVLLVWLLVKGLGQSCLPGRLVVLAVVVTLAVQTLLAAALNFGFVLFSAGLPLVVGNLQTVVDLALIGLALSVFRGASIAREEPEKPLRQRKRLRIRVEYQ